MPTRAGRLSDPAATVCAVGFLGPAARRRAPRARAGPVLFCALGALALAVEIGSPASAAVDPAPRAPRPVVEAPQAGDDHPGLLERRRRAARDAAVQGVLDGRLQQGPDGVVELPSTSDTGSAVGTEPLPGPSTTPYAEVAATGTDRVFTLLVDFGPGDYGDRTWNGPVHGELPERSEDGLDAGLDGSAAHYERLLFGADAGSLRSYLRAQSGGRYTIDGTVQGWVAVPYNAARYGADDCSGDCDERVAEFVADAMDAFVADFYASSPAGSLAAFLAPYDQRDRYDSDADGSFSEPDGYLDRVLLVFAGAGQDATGGVDQLRTRFASISGDTVGPGGPTRNPLGGHELGSSGLWVDAYSAVPEDVGLGTLVHAYGHELGLPDLSDPAGSAAVDSSVQFWSPMAGGGRLAALGRAGAAGRAADGAGTSAPGTAAPDFLAVERLQLGWLDDHQVLAAEQSQTVRLVDRLTGRQSGSQPGAPPGDGVSAAVVTLGDLAFPVRLATPAEGARAFVAAVGPSSAAVLAVPLPNAAGRVTWRQWTDVETTFDTVRVQALDRSGWRDIAPVTTGRTGWVTRSAPVPLGAERLRFVYTTDHLVTGPGVLIDDIQVGTEAAEGAEHGLPPGWTATGWESGDGTVSSAAAGYYIAERRDLSGYDEVLRAGAFVADLRRGGDVVDHFGYEDGVLMTFWDARAADNAVSAHAGSGRLLVVDARPAALETASGGAAPPGLHPFDAPFGLSWLRGFAVDAYAVAPSGELTADRVRVRAQPPVPTFDDTDPRYASGSAGAPRLPGAGVSMTVTAETESATTVRFEPPAPRAVTGAP